MAPTPRGRRGEARLPSALVTVAAIALYALLPEQLILGPRLVIPSLEALLLVVLVCVNPRRMTRDNRWIRVTSLGLVCLVGVVNTVALVLLLRQLVSTGSSEAVPLLFAAGQVWLTNVIVYALAFWELDRGGPVARTRLARNDLPKADFRFPQDEDHDTVVEVNKGSSKVSGWVPTLVDYAYMSVTNSSAFSPTDTMPLSPRAKMLMALEAFGGFIILALVIARAVSLIG
jgi:hypothetical protein